MLIGKQNAADSVPRLKDMYQILLVNASSPTAEGRLCLTSFDACSRAAWYGDRCRSVTINTAVLVRCKKMTVRIVDKHFTYLYQYTIRCFNDCIAWMGAASVAGPAASRRHEFEPENRTELDFANPTHICEGLSQV